MNRRLIFFTEEGKIKPEIRFLSISVIAALVIFGVFMFLSVHYHIKPGTYAFTESNDSLIVYHGIIQPESIELSTENPLRNALIKMFIKEIDVSWATILLMLCYFFALLFNMRLNRGRIKACVKSNIIPICIAGVLVIESSYRIIEALKNLTDYNLF